MQQTENAQRRQKSSKRKRQRLSGPAWMKSTTQTVRIFYGTQPMLKNGRIMISWSISLSSSQSWFVFLFSHCAIFYFMYVLLVFHHCCICSTTCMRLHTQTWLHWSPQWRTHSHTWQDGKNRTLHPLSQHSLRREHPHPLLHPLLPHHLHLHSHPLHPHRHPATLLLLPLQPPYKYTPYSFILCILFLSYTTRKFSSIGLRLSRCYSIFDVLRIDFELSIQLFYTNFVLFGLTSFFIFFYHFLSY